MNSRGESIHSKDGSRNLEVTTYYGRDEKTIYALEILSFGA